MLRNALALVAAAVLAAWPAPTASAAASVPVLVLEGKGFGHGVGMAQDGALAFGRQGLSTEQILGQFYPGTQLGTASGQVRVVVLTSSDGETVVTFPGGGELRSPLDGPQAPGFPVAVAAGGSVRLRYDGRYRAEPIQGATIAARAMTRAVVAQLPPLPGGSTTTTTTAPGSSTTTTTPPPLTPPLGPPGTTTTSTTAPGQTTTTAAPPPGLPGTTATTTAPPPTEPPPPESTVEAAESAGPLFAVPVAGATVGVPGRSAVYRGYVEATAAAGPLRLLNTLDVEDYLRGMGEVRDGRWPAGALGAQAVAARTYALRAMAANGEICDTQRCQVYLGQQAEYPQMDAAVAATRGWVLAFGGELASSVYSASAGGTSATPAEGFGTTDAEYPYLRAAPHPTANPMPWSRTVALADVAARLRYAGELTGVRVLAVGPSGRALTVELTGAAGPRTVTGLELGRALAVPSTLWTALVGEAEVAPPPPPPPVDAAAVAGQALPEDVGTVIAQDVARATAAAPAERPERNDDDDDGPDVAAWFTGALVAVMVTAGAYGATALRPAERGP